MNSCYQSLFSLISDAHRTHLSICIVTPDLLGPVKNGGIGTACTHLAYALAEGGHTIHLCYSSYGAQYSDSESWIQELNKHGIAVTVAAAWDKEKGSVKKWPEHDPLIMASIVYEWLNTQKDFDLVFFMDWQGHGFYAIQAKSCGLKFRNTALVSIIHSPSLWHTINNADISFHCFHSCTWFMERFCIEHADAIISPSAYMLNWCREHGYLLPKKSFVQQNLLNLTLNTSIELRPVFEIVFFGRLEYRKGITQFCNALDIMAQRKSLPSRITFLGKFSWIGAEHAALYISHRSVKWEKSQITILSHLNQSDAIRYIQSSGRLVVMPSVADNSPYTVYESLLAGIPFLARCVGGVAELIHPEDHDRCLFGDRPVELAEKMASMLGKIPVPVRLSFDPAKNLRAWIQGLPELVRHIRLESGKPEELTLPTISVCLTHYNRPHFLKQAIHSLLNQDYPHFEVILTDDGSTNPDAIRYIKKLKSLFDKKGWIILRLQNGYLGHARNEAVAVAKGEYVLFMDDDNVAMPHMVGTFARAAAASKVDICTTSFAVFQGNTYPDMSTPIMKALNIGGSIAFSTISNLIGDANALIRRSTFLESGGFTEDYGLGHEDFELFIKLILRGATVRIIPDMLFWYRKNEHSMLRTTHNAANRMRSLRPFLESTPSLLRQADFGELALLTHSLGVQEQVKAERKAAAPKGISDAEKEQYGLGAPNSPAILTKIASSLFIEGHRDMAHSIMETTPGTDEETSLLLKMLFQADHLLRTEDGIPLSQKIKNSYQLIQQALEEADRQYLDFRHDVKRAVKEGQFDNGLHHYIRHGHSEGMIWPAESLFKLILNDIPLLPETSDILCLARNTFLNP